MSSFLLAVTFFPDLSFACSLLARLSQIVKANASFFESATSTSLTQIHFRPSSEKIDSAIPHIMVDKSGTRHQQAAA